ncbi:anti-phage ZorAB system protein ZorA [Herminiimonas contaminans]|uniref:Anti-phage defense ZorAB system ZorA n=1 Tax=Herminiimonas contaminans TaxID=1111140 RepID=A0ABS0EU83_9BURK|nr:anti-phage ZorAB system protein ZorA [Herminiimonas contaminans]MBF8178403.1 anti-phage defense ZorAB system ZorA [Herminiimonas contaminans]
MGDIDLARLAAEYWHMGLLAIVLVGITIDFLLRFVGQSIKLSRELKDSLAALRAIRSDINGGEVTELDEIGQKAMSGPALDHLWKEYSKTLHPQKEDDEHGHKRIARWRSTALAESFFTEQAIVDSRLKTEFFKHLPGLLTGLGIIGTFLGLIKGLISFDVSLDPTQAQEQLRNLVNSVGHAFFVSASAIFLAMLFTWIEKSVVTSRCKQVEELRELIDSLFKSGAGEEYLERLVISSENASTQSQQIKDALVADLKEILTTLATRQMEAQAQNVGQMSSDVGKAIAESLSGPMAAITKAVEGVSSNQGDAVNKMLTDVLASFASQMREMFGGQMAGMSELMVKASESMQATAIEFKLLAANMDAAGTNTVDAMGERLGKALEAMDARQSAMNTQMGAFVEQIKALVSESQTESSQKLKDTLSAVGDQVAGVVEQLRKQAEHAAESQGDRQNRFEQTTGQAIGSLSGQVEQLLAQSMETNKSLQNTVAGLTQATDKAISGLSSGADTVLVAANAFAKAGDGVSETMRASAVATEAIKVASAQLTMSTDGAKMIFADYAKTRDTFAIMVAELKETIDNAKRDASMTSEIIGRIEKAAQQLTIAQKQSEEYLQGVSEVLVKAHESFRENVENTLREGNRMFQTELSSSVQLLSGAIKNLGDVVDDIPPRR